MRTAFPIAAFVILLGLPFVIRQMLTSGQGPSVPVTRGAPTLVIITPHNQDIRREYAVAFNDWHKRKFGSPVNIDYRTPGGTNDIKRQLENNYAAFRDPKTGKLPENVRADIHIAWGGGDTFFDRELKKLGSKPEMNVLAPLRFDPAELARIFPTDTLAGVRLYDAAKDKDGKPAPGWVGVCLSAFGIVYNPDVYASLGLSEPRAWGDLADERLHGLVALADPTHSGSASVAYMMVIQRAMADEEARFFAANADIAKLPRAEREKNPAYQAALARGWKEGMRQLLIIAANARYFSDAANMVPNDVANGQAAAGMVIDFYGRFYQESLGQRRVKFLAPAAATAITPDPIAILHGVKGEEYKLAMRFIEFLLSQEGQLLWIKNPGTPNGPIERSLRRPPIRRDVYAADRGQWADGTNPFDDAGNFNMRGEWMGPFSNTRLIWTAAWIATRDDLKSAYAEILEVKDPARRTALIGELGDLPIEYADVLAMPKTQEEAAKQGIGADEWRAMQRIEWSKKFRGHYRAIEAKAE